ncbi:MAG: hypothetical protein LJE92_18025 [Gammaproteobacteria bacterium]|nr:hypothetical protein [Gammaproteobacteria bacterium]
MKPLSFALLLTLTLSSSPDLVAQDSLQLEGTSITGNKELPRVLYILPWKTVERFEIESPPITSIMDQELQPLDRATFKRTIHYHQAINAKAEPVRPVTE